MPKSGLRTNMRDEVWNVLGESIVCKVRGTETFGRFAVVEETSPPKGAVPPHLHKQTDKIIYVLEGKYEMRIGGEISIAKQGDVIVIPRNTPHGFRNLLDTSSKMLAIITPSGFENFFAEVNRLNHAGMANVVEIGKRNDLELIV